MGALSVVGTTSDAGKTVVVAGLCRLLARRGVSVAPFKAQNMSLNAAVTADGAEIGRAQALQAAACGIEPEATMNPILLKPIGERTSQVIVLGRAAGVVEAGAYAPTDLWPVVLDALADLRRRFDVVVCEGAGGAAEINLLGRDVVNLPLAARAGMPAVVVGDIDRGGVFASLYGTWALLPEELRSCIRGFLINKLRGDPALLGDGPAELERRSGVPVLGVLPWAPGIDIDAEDSLALDRAGGGDGPVDVAVIRLPRTSNSTDLDPLRLEPSVTVRWVAHPAQLGRPHLVVLPGTRSTVADLDWLRGRGLDRAITSSGAAVLGICGGYQMCGRTIHDDVESGAGSVEGLGLLDATTRFAAEKVVDRWGTGYRIHHGRVRGEGQPWLDGVRSGRVFGTTVHGLFEDDGFREGFLAEVGGAHYEPAGASFAAAREAQLDRLADLLEAHADVDRLLALTDEAHVPSPATPGQPRRTAAAGASTAYSPLRSLRRMTPDDVSAAHQRLLDLVAGLTDAQARGPSVLPGWTIGHVLTHIARNADSFTWLAEGATAGEVRDQYPGGAEQRNADIDVGAGRPAAELVADVREASARLEGAFAAADAWEAAVRTSAGEVPLRELLLRRVREVEIHTSDLGLGHSWHDWSDAFVDGQLDALGGDRRRHLVAFLAGRAEQPPGLFG